MSLVPRPLEGLWDPKGWWASLRHPGGSLRTLVGDGAVYSLVVLFGLNTVDELDRTAFGILLPSIRDHFGLSDTGILSIITLTAFGAILLQLPIATMADRSNRVRMVVVGASVWALFSLLTGMATSIWMLCLVRAGSGIGQATVEPTHNSLLSDYYAVDRRPAVFSFHRGANALGMILGPLLGGLLSHWFGWRVPFIVFTIPTVVFVVLALRLHEPIRGAREKEAMGASAEAIAT